MIVVKLIGGLGNQMFQYAAGKALSIKHEVPLFVDTVELEALGGERFTKRNLELQQLKVDLHFVNDSIRAEFTQSRIERIFWRLQKGRRGKVFSESSRQFDPLFFELGPHIYLNGFWQCENYFDKIKDVLAHEFKPNYSFDIGEEKLLEQIRSVDSVAIHVRRGDYLSNREANQFHGLCDMEYYDSAMKQIGSQISNPVFFIFSDDMAWCRRNFLEKGNVFFVETNSPHSSLDLFLMHYCKHQIIANSSYSWWAAWLNANDKKIVYAPKNWFADSNIETDVHSINWIKI